MSSDSFDSLQWPALFANLVMGDLHLMIPQSEIFSLEPAMEMQPESTPSLAVGELERDRQHWPLYAFDAHLNRLAHWPEHYRIAILLKHVNPIYGLLCEQVYSVKRSDFIIQPVPMCQRSEHSPLLALALYDEEVRCISSAAALAPLLIQ